MCRGDTPTFRLSIQKNTIDGFLDWEPTIGLDYDIVFAIKEKGGTEPLYKVKADDDYTIFLPEEATGDLEPGKYRWEVSLNIYEDGELSYHDTFIENQLLIITDEVYGSRNRGGDVGG